MMQLDFLAVVAVLLLDARVVSGLPTTIAQETCPFTFDGRIPKNFTKATFTTPQNPFNPKYVLGHSMNLQLDR